MSDRINRNAEKKSIKDGTYTPRAQHEREPDPPDWRDNFKFGE